MDKLCTKESAEGFVHSHSQGMGLNETLFIKNCGIALTPSSEIELRFHSYGSMCLYFASMLPWLVNVGGGMLDFCGRPSKHFLLRGQLLFFTHPHPLDVTWENSFSRSLQPDFNDVFAALPVNVAQKSFASYQ